MAERNLVAEFVTAYRAAARQLYGPEHILGWLTLDLDVPAQDAAAWANLGYMPAEAAPLIAQGITPAMALAAQEAAAAGAGSGGYAMLRVDELVADGTIVNPRRVSTREDPDDPMHIIVTVRPE